MAFVWIGPISECQLGPLGDRCVSAPCLASSGRQAGPHDGG